VSSSVVRVTVGSSAGRRDLVVPGSLLVGDLVQLVHPDLAPTSGPSSGGLGLRGPRAGRGREPVVLGWDGCPIDLGRSLLAQGVVDGDLLWIADASSEVEPPRIAPEPPAPPPSLVDRVLGTRERQVLASLTMGMLTVVLGGLVLGLPVAQRELAALLAVGSSMATAVVVFHLGKVRALGRAVAGAALLLWGLAGIEAVRSVTGPGRHVVLVLLVAGFVVVGTALSALTLNQMAPVVVGVAFVAVPVVVGAPFALLWHGSLVDLAAALDVVWVFVLSYLPRLASTVSGLTAVARPRLDASEAPIEIGELRRRLTYARRTLLGGTLGCVAGLVGAWLLLFDHGIAALLLVGASAAAVGARTRRHRQVWEVVAFGIAAVVGLLLCSAALVLRVAERGRADELAGVVVVGMALLAAFSWFGAKRTGLDEVQVAQAVKRFEVLVRLALIPLVLQVYDVYLSAWHWALRIGNKPL
jgi:hypothetical protein